jgi:hypothetical protein
VEKSRENHGFCNPCRLPGLPRAQVWVGKYQPMTNPHLQRGLAQPAAGWIFRQRVTAGGQAIFNSESPTIVQCPPAPLPPSTEPQDPQVAVVHLKLCFSRDLSPPPLLSRSQPAMVNKYDQRSLLQSINFLALQSTNLSGCNQQTFRITINKLFDSRHPYNLTPSSGPDIPAPLHL